MNLVSFALRRPVTVVVLVIAVVLAGTLAAVRMSARHLPRPEPPGDLRRPALRRHGPGADGRAAHQLLRVPLPLHHRHPPRRVEERPGHGPDEAVLPPRHRHGPGDGRDGRLRQPLARVHAAGHRPAVHHAVRRRQRAGRLPRPLQRDRSRSARSRTRRCSRSGRCSRRLPGVSAPPPFGGSQRTDRRPRRSRPAARLQHVARRGGRRALDHGQHDQPVGQRPHRRPDADRADQLDGQRRQGAGDDPDPRRRRRRRSTSATSATVEDARRHPDRLRPGQRPAGGLHPGHQAGRRLDARGRRTWSRRTCRRCRRSCPTDIKVSFEFDQSPYVTRADRGRGDRGRCSARS